MPSVQIHLPNDTDSIPFDAPFMESWCGLRSCDGTWRRVSVGNHRRVNVVRDAPVILLPPRCRKQIQILAKHGIVLQVVRVVRWFVRKHGL